MTPSWPASSAPEGALRELFPGFDERRLVVLAAAIPFLRGALDGATPSTPFSKF
jgi:hypothetical protein